VIFRPAATIKGKMKIKSVFYIFLVVLTTVFAISYFVKIGTGLYYADSPIVRWKFAIYTGECDDETGCHYLKMEETGVFEYFGLKEIPLIDKKTPSTNKNLSLNDTLATVKSANDLKKSNQNIHKDTLQYLMESENEENIYSMFLTRQLDSNKIRLD
jgi:hypothetical protein